MVDLPRRPVARRPPTPRRLAVVVVLVVSLLATLIVRLYYLQLLDPGKPVQTAGATHTGVIVLPAPRGTIVDDEGNPLVANTATQVVQVDRDVLERQHDHGTATLRRLATLIGRSPTLLAKQITPCSPHVPAPCSTAEPFAPVTVLTDASARVVLAIGERREDYPGVTVTTVTEPVYPGGSLAAQVLGYTSDVTAADLAADKSLDDDDTIGVSGLEQQYDAILRGTDGTQDVDLDPQGVTVGFSATTPAVAGDTLVTSINAKVQALAQKALATQIAASRAKGYKAPSGSVVIMDPNTGRIVAAASYPTYDPGAFTGGISDTAYAKLTDAASGQPLLNRATAGEYAPGSTFKLITASSLVMHHEISENKLYPCPGSLDIDGEIKTNYDSEQLGMIDLRNALGYSCDTYFYRPAANEYYADQRRIAHHEQPHEWIQRMAAAFGIGQDPGVDLPAGEQTPGSYADRETRLADWKLYRSDWCAQAKSGYKDVADPTRRAYLTLLASQNCTDGWRYRAGDNADLSIGQGETTLSPLQLAVAYSAMLNGGRIWEPTFGWAVTDAAGHVIRRIDPKVRNRVPVSPQVFDYIAKSLDFSRGWAVSGAFAYIGSKIQDRLGGKTGTAQVYGKQDTSWLASWGPTYTQGGNVRAHLVMVGMITEAGTGAFAAGPMEKQIWDGLFGTDGSAPLLPGVRAPTTLPAVTNRITELGR